MKRIMFILCLFSLAACSDAEEEPRLAPRPFTAVVAETGKDTFQGAVGAISEPFEDVGIKRQPIPERLAALVDDPYRPPSPPVCINVQEELIALNAALGLPKEDSDIHRKAFRDEGASIIEKQALSMLRGQVQVLPLRGVVRRVSGADRHARKVIRAYEAGSQRRAFLKGIATAYGCKIG